MEHAVIYAFKSPGSGAVYIGKRECDPTAWPRRGNGRLPDGYKGSGNVVPRFHERHGAAVQWRILAIVPLDDWVRAERRAIHLARLIFGRLCVNQRDGGDGFTSREAKARAAAPGWKDRRNTPEVREKRSINGKAFAATPEGAAQLARAREVAKSRAHLPERRAQLAVATAASRTPEARAKARANISITQKALAQTPEGRARLEQLAQFAKAPDVRAKNSANRKARLLTPEGAAQFAQASDKAHGPAARAKAAATRRRRTHNRRVMARFRHYIPPINIRPGVTVWACRPDLPLGFTGPMAPR